MLCNGMKELALHKSSSQLTAFFCTIETWCRKQGRIRKKNTWLCSFFATSLHGVFK